MFLQKSLPAFRVLVQDIARIPRVASAPFSSASSPQNQEALQVEVSPDGKTIFCWHPEPTFPYEHTKPLPRKAEEIKESDSVLKVQYLKDEMQKYSPDGPSKKELVKMFTTQKYFFRPRPRRRYSKQNPPVDRKSI